MELQKDLLGDLEPEKILTPANKWRRFANLLIDMIVIFSLVFVLLVIYDIVDPESFDEYMDSDSYGLVGVVLYNIPFVIYFTVMEATTNGRTVGKWITGTRAVKEDGSSLTWKDAFLRGLIRMVPLEVFSGIGRVWHDKWTLTTVVRKNAIW